MKWSQFLGEVERASRPYSDYAGLDRGYVGRALLGGRSVQDLSDDQLSAYRAQSVGIIFQSFHLLDHLSAAENVDLGARLPLKPVLRALRTYSPQSVLRVGVMSNPR